MSATARLPVEEVSRGVYPFYLTRIVGLMIITYVPWLSLALLPG
jgi:C4-dicarboxylate transporter DctM subunit